MRKLLFFSGILFSFTALGEPSSLMKNVSHEISKHYSALPSLYQLDAVTKEQLSDKIIRQYVMGSQSMLVKWTFKKGAIIPMHFHPNEQITWITKGSVQVHSQGKEFIVKAGEILIIPPYVPHEFYALEDTIDIDFFSPVREDWFSNNAGDYLKSK